MQSTGQTVQYLIGFRTVSRYFTFGLTCLAIGISMISAQPPGGPAGGGGNSNSGPSYRIVGLDSANGMLEGWPQAINGQNLIVGYVNILGGDATAACWTVSESSGAVVSTLHLLTGESANGANDAGEIVGSADGKAVYWPDYEADPIVLPIPQGYVGSAAVEINDEGLICGEVNGTLVGTSRFFSNAVIWRVNKEIVNNHVVINVWGPLVLSAPLGAEVSSAHDVNDLDSSGVATVVGVSNPGSVVSAWRIEANGDGSVSVESGPAIVDVQAYAYTVNNLGEVCGNRWTNDSFDQGTVWDSESTYTLDSAGITTGGFFAYDINDRGMIVGDGSWNGRGNKLSHKALMWHSPQSAMVQLDSFLKRSSFSELSSASSVNDTGRIVGTGWDADLQINRGYMAIPK